MFRTDASRYAIRAITHLACRADNETPVSAAEVGAAEGIPPYYLAKVLQSLAHAGFVESSRGREGGFRLKRSPGEIHVLEIIDAMEEKSHLTQECVLGLGECDDEDPCPLHGYWQRCRESLEFHLGDVTVADLVVESKRKHRQVPPEK